jgi:chemotaxis protein methyltransferase CheR
VPGAPGGTADATPPEPQSYWPGIVPISDREFRLFQDLVHAETGIYLSNAKKALLAGRLSRRLRELGLRSFGDYYERVSGVDRDERVRMAEAICTHETRFFREPQQFRFLEEHVYPGWKSQAAAGRRSRRISVWSAACSTGEEPYSIAMQLLDQFPAEAGWSVDVLATDLSRRVLAQAEAGVWPIERAEQIPLSYLKRFMLKGTRSETGRIMADAPLRALVRCAQLNLNGASYPGCGRFDLIFCRNVLIYFSPQARREVVHRLVSQHLAPGGYLLLGHAETVHDLKGQLQPVGPSICTPSVGTRPTP